MKDNYWVGVICHFPICNAGNFIIINHNDPYITQINDKS